MNRKITPFILFLVSLLCFLATAALYFNLPSLGTDQDYENAVADISVNLNDRIAVSRQDAQGIASQLRSDTATFSSLLKQTKNPTFIYRSGRLVFWSDHTIIPDLDFPPVFTRPTAVTNNFGTFVVVPHQERSYSILVYIPLQIDYRISNDYLLSGLQKNIFNRTYANLVLDQQADLPQVTTERGEYLFSMELQEVRNSRRAIVLELLLLTLGVVFFVLFAVVWSNRLFKQGKYSQGVILLLVLLIGLRLTLLLLNLPFAITETDLFDPRLYAASFWSPSVGDLALNMLLLLTIAWASFYLFRKNNVLSQLKTLPRQKARYLQVACVGASYLLLFVLYRFYYGIYHNSPLALDITQELDLSRYKLIIYGTMFLHTAALCIFTYMLATVVAVLLPREPRGAPYKLLGAVAVVLLVLLVVLGQVNYISIVLAGVFFWLTIFVSAQHRSNVTLPYRTYLFFFLIMAVSAITGASALYAHYQSELKEYKQSFAFNILQDNDVLGEYFLEDVSAKIANDALIRMKMMGPYVDAPFIKRKISKQYLRNYFDKYETHVLLFDAEGRALESADASLPTLQEIRRKYNKPQYRTERRDLYLINDPAKYNGRLYLKFIEVPIGFGQKGTILLQLTLKRMLPHSLVPELLVDQRHSQPFRLDMLSYAIYQQGRLSYSEGEYDYATNFNRSLMRRSELYNQGTTQGSHHHLGIRDGQERVLVITTENYGAREILSNFSFLFLLFTAGLIIGGLFLVLVQREWIREFRPNFSTKIQLFLNLGILLPLLLVSITTAGLVTSSYKRDLMRTYEQRGEAIQQNLISLLDPASIESRRLLQQKIEEVASISETDINLYDRYGRLIVTSQPLIFEAGLLSKLINPEAYAAISERQALRVQQDEQAGNLTFNALYLPLREGGNLGEIQGFLGIPFFDSEKQLDLKLIELITTTMNIFTIMFIMFILLTFFASRALTVPLRMLAEKLKRTSLTGKNEMLAYKGTDEIGMLVNEYNRMLLTLEQNKVELAMREKEAAWREMARQVAHEIKNPLTPMKLSLQYLQKAIAEKKPNTEQLIDKISDTLITQINILSDIATSFSNFTSMPEPKAERMDVAAALRKAVDLHNDPTTAVLTTAIPDTEVIVKADENLMVRTFNNLLLNAIQAVPASRQPHLHVALQLQPDETVLISISDNGSGIPAEIHSKVFIPNFSTKYTGSGIGLAVARRGIENAGGRIWFETEAEKGTTFYIALPLASP